MKTKDKPCIFRWSGRWYVRCGVGIDNNIAAINHALKLNKDKA